MESECTSGIAMETQADDSVIPLHILEAEIELHLGAQEVLDDAVVEIVGDVINESVVETSQESIDESVVETLPESICEPVVETSQEIIDETVVETLPESICEPVVLPSQESIDESVVETLPESICEPVVVASQESIDESVVETLLESICEPVVETSQERIHESVVVTLPDIINDPVAVTKQESIHESAVETSPTTDELADGYRIVESQRRRRKLMDQAGYTYTLKKAHKGTMFWRCSVRNKNVCCRATVMQKGVLFKKGSHGHSHVIKKRGSTDGKKAPHLVTIEVISI